MGVASYPRFAPVMFFSPPPLRDETKISLLVDMASILSGFFRYAISEESGEKRSQCSTMQRKEENQDLPASDREQRRLSLQLRKRGFAYVLAIPPSAGKAADRSHAP